MPNDSPLDVMKSIVATEWSPSDGPSETIGGWLKFIAAKYPNMAPYCLSVLNMDYFEWCGLAVGYSMAKAGIAPVFGTTQLTEFLWAEAWLGWGQAVSTPASGDVLVFDWGGGNQHVTLFSSDAGNGLWSCLGGNQSHEVKYSNYPRSKVIGIRRPGAAGMASAAAARDVLAAAAASVDDPSVHNSYQDFDVIAYAKTTMTTREIAAGLASSGLSKDVQRAAYAMICNESANGNAGINNNYGGLQADSGRWSSVYDQYISATCVKRDISGTKRRFLCFNEAQGCFSMIAGLVQSRGIYVGGTTHFISNMHVSSPADWALAYYREWVTGSANATLSQGALHSLIDLYQSAINALP